MAAFSSVKIEEIMTRQLLTVAPDEVMERVRDIFEHYSIHHIPVVEGEKVVGMISREDYFKIIHGFCLNQSHTNNSYNDALLRSLLAEEVMSKNLTSLGPADSLPMAAKIFRENIFHAIPIVDEAKKLVGIITTYDLINFAYREEEVVR